MKLIRVYGLTCVLLLSAMAASATTIVMPTDEQLVGKAAVIVEGTVLTSQAVDREGAIWTETTLRVEKTLKGAVPETITIAEVGGIVGDRITKIFGRAEYAAGERVLLFLNKGKSGHYRTVDLFVGKFSAKSTLDGTKLWFRDDAGAEVVMLDAQFQPLDAAQVQRDAVRFETFINNETAGKPSAANYGVENPVLARGTSSRDRFTIDPNFTLLVEPTIYRWSRFDRSQTAPWVSFGTQPGYGNGGVSELQTAMSAWTSYAQANIRYTYSGATNSSTPGGLDRPNGVNEVLFNDPQQDIDGSWSPSAGGVVGLGGFNGVTSGGAWTSPFAADANHGLGTFSSVSITEGNLTIQDGVSPSTGISSSRLAEIISHEFGHTLGFGHSEDSTALMYFRVTGNGPSLKSDDQVAARWLYPSGSGTPTTPTGSVPTAPTGLTATTNGTQLTLNWNDNSTDETGFGIFVATQTGSFTRTTNIGANSRTATLSGLAANTYRVYVVAYNAQGDSTASNTVTITLSTTPQPAVASFTVSPASGTAGVTNFVFTDTSTGTITSRAWVFGDGGTGTAASVSRIYANGGSFNVVLTVTGGGASSSATKTITVTGPLNANFTFTPANPTTSDNVEFVDNTTGGATSWLWNFGDGTSSSLQNPVKRFNNAGSYTVVLTAFRGSESKVISKSLNVASTAPALSQVTASFEAPTSANTGIEVQFLDRSSGSPDRWSWNFGDGTTSTLANPTHAYPGPGTYYVTLVAGNAISSSSSSRVVVVSPLLVPYRSLISATAQTSGAGGSQWRTELSLFNAGSDAANVTLSFIPGAGSAVQTRSLFLLPRQSLTYGNALLDVFGMTSGAGALSIEATSAVSSPDLRVSSRTFTTGASGTYGQSVPDVATGSLPDTLYLAGLASSTSFRTNIGLVNRTGAALSSLLTLYASDGTLLGGANVAVGPNSFQQMALTTLFPEIASRSLEGVSLKVVSSAADAVSVYGSIVDNRTQDPVYVQGLAAPTGGSLIVPAVGRAPGAQGTFWRSDVTFFNPTRERMLLSLRYLAAGADNRSASMTPLAISAGSTIVMSDLLASLGMQAGSGAFEVMWNSGSGPIVGSRTYTTAEGSNGGTYGQSIDPVTTFSRQAYVAGLRSDSSFRSNIGLVNASGETMGVTLELLSSTGQTVGSAFVQLAAKSQTQSSLSSLFPNVNAAAVGSFTLMARTDSPTGLFAYGSIVDNTSGDPVFFAGR